MVFNQISIPAVTAVVATIWLGALTVFFFRLQRHYNTVTKGVAKAGLKEILDTMLKNQGLHVGRLSRLETALESLTDECGFHIQKIGIVRFNPFNDTGGSQSFSMALLDLKDTGIVITSLHARSGNRWYVKEVVKGKGIGVELSQEEQSVIRKAGKRKTT